MYPSVPAIKDVTARTVDAPLARPIKTWVGRFAVTGLVAQALLRASGNRYDGGKQMMTAGKLTLVLTTTNLFGTALSGLVSAADAPANDRQWSMEPAWVQELTIESDFTVFMAPQVSAETQRLALRKLWRLLEWEGDGLNCYESGYAATETVRPAKVADGAVSAMRGAHR